MSPFPTFVRAAGRRLLRTPVFTAAALVTLAVGIGANTAIFSVVNGVLLKPLPYEDPERLVGTWHTAPGLGFDVLNQSPALYLTYRAESRLLEDAALWDNTTLSVTGLDRPEQVPALLVTDGFFPMLGVSAARGRVFSREDDQPGAPLTILLSHGYWQQAFGGDPGVIGRTLMVSGRQREIIGVLPEGFRFLEHDASIYFPPQFDPAQVFVGNFSYQGIARMKPGVSEAQVKAELEPLVRVAMQRYPGPVTESMMEQAHFGALVRPLKADQVGDVGSVLWVLLGTVAMVLLIACANVANLFMVRAEGRVRDVAVRTALGAGRRHVAGQFLGESVLLGVAGGVVGLGLAWGGIRLLVALAPALPRLHEVTLSPTVLAFTLAISVLAGLLFGAIPLLRYGRPDLVSALKEGSRGSTGGRERHRARNGLVVAQVALALVLLVGSGLMVRSFQALRAVAPGFERPEEVFTFRIGVPGAVEEDPARVALLYEQVHANLAAIPGVRAVGGSSSVTMDRYDSNDPVLVEDDPVEAGQLPPVRRLKWVLPGYFETMENRLIAGRTLTWDDIHRRADVALVTEDFAREYWGDARQAVGRRITIAIDLTGGAPRWREIVGVVGSVHDDGVDQAAVPVVYWPAAIEDFWEPGLMVQRGMAFTLRTAPERMGTLLPQVQRAVWSVNASLPVADVRTLEEIRSRSLARTSFTLVMLVIAAAVALLLGAVGLYGVISYSVSQRSREIGVRMALGAQRADVSRMVVGEGMALAGVGLVVGLVTAFGATRLMSSLLFGVQAVDPLTYGTVALVLAAVALLASWLPARRATGLDPSRTLRQE
ncbi:MAG TPA: ABC transporter permease [Longimicrobiales bacterium]|nr:ABC transporter permease [Longimicrobiales bacterium]